MVFKFSEDLNRTVTSIVLDKYRVPQKSVIKEFRTFCKLLSSWNLNKTVPNVLRVHEEEKISGQPYLRY